MNAALRHRGPEGSGLWQNEKVTLGHTALRLSDRNNPASEQPMQSSCGRYSLVYNGEIYNHLSLRRLPEMQGIRFRSQSDTETLLHLLALKGVAALPLLNGMFAFAFHNSESRQTLLARDRFGIKPLFYRTGPNTLIASSELCGLAAGPGPALQPDYSQIPHYLCFRNAAAPGTFYKGVSDLQPGHFLLLNHTPSGNLTQTLTPFLPASFAKASPAYSASSASDLLELTRRTEEALIASVERQLRTEVPAGLLLSGGTDSTLLAALIAEAGYKNLPAFSVVNTPSEACYGSHDYKYAESAALLYGFRPHLITPSHALLHRLPEMVHTLGQPIADGAALLTQLIAREAKPYATILYSGAGADELFAGYNRHQAFYKYLSLQKLLPGNMLLAGAGAGRYTAHTLARLFAGFTPADRYGLTAALRRLSGTAAGISADPVTTFLHFSALPGFTTGFFRDGVFESTFTKATDKLVNGLKTGSNRHMQQALAFEQSGYLVNDVLALTDRAAMAHSVEVRVPYLDNDVAALAALIPASELFKGGRKKMLFNMLNNRGGAAFTKRRKEGFGMPFGEWLRRPEYGYLRELILNQEMPVYKYVHNVKAAGMLQAHLSRKADFSRELFALLVLALWCEKQVPKY